MFDYKPRILVVDDEKFNRTVLADLLKGEYTVVLAKDGKQGLDKAHSEYPPDLIILDIMMPGMDGYTACQRLKESPLTRDIPVVFVTARPSTTFPSPSARPSCWPGCTIIWPWHPFFCIVQNTMLTTMWCG